MNALLPSSSHQIAQLCYIRDDSTIAAYVSGQGGKITASDVADIRRRYGKNLAHKPWFRLKEGFDLYMGIQAKRELLRHEKAALLRILKDMEAHPDRSARGNDVVWRSAVAIAEAPEAPAVTAAPVEGRRCFSRRDYEIAKSMAAEGMNLAQIGRVLGFSRTTVRDNLSGRSGNWEGKNI